MIQIKTKVFICTKIINSSVFQFFVVFFVVSRLASLSIAQLLPSFYRFCITVFNPETN